MPAEHPHEDRPRRRRRRAVGPAGAPPADEAGLDLGPADGEQPPADDDERLLREVPPHHG